MEILINYNDEQIKVNILEVPITKEIKDFETYFNNSEAFLKKYTDLSNENIKTISNNVNILSEIIYKFISLNKLDSKEFFTNNFYSNITLINSLKGMMIFQLMNFDYKPEYLLKLSSKELFETYIFVFSKEQLNFPTKAGFDFFCKLLEENYGKEEKDSFLKFFSPIVNGNSYDIGEEELFKKELKELSSI